MTFCWFLIFCRLCDVSCNGGSWGESNWWVIVTTPGRQIQTEHSENKQSGKQKQEQQCKQYQGGGWGQYQQLCWLHFQPNWTGGCGRTSGWWSTGKAIFSLNAFLCNVMFFVTYLSPPPPLFASGGWGGGGVGGSKKICFSIIQSAPSVIRVFLTNHNSKNTQ